MLNGGREHRDLARNVGKAHQDTAQIGHCGRVHHRQRSGRYGMKRQDHLGLLHNDRQKRQAAMEQQGAVSADQRDARKARYLLLAVEQARRMEVNDDMVGNLDGDAGGDQVETAFGLDRLGDALADVLRAQAADRVPGQHCGHQGRQHSGAQYHEQNFAQASDQNSLPSTPACPGAATPAMRGCRPGLNSNFPCRPEVSSGGQNNPVASPCPSRGRGRGRGDT